MMHKWPYHTLKVLAASCRTKKEFRTKFYLAYISAHQRRILDIIQKDLNQNRVMWTYDLVKTEALKYSTVSEFRSSAGGAFNFAVRTGTLRTVCAHMTKRTRHRFKWTLKTAFENARKYKNYNEYRRAKGSSCRQAERKGWNKRITKILRRLRIWKS